MNQSLLYFLAGCGVMAALMVGFQFWIVKAVTRYSGQAQAMAQKRKRQIGIMPLHPRRAEALHHWSIFQDMLRHGAKHSRFAHFRSETGKPAQGRGPSCYSYSITGAITLTVFPEDVPDSEDSQMDRAWRGELQDLMLGLVWALMPIEYENVEEFSNFAPWPEIEKLLDQGKVVLSKLPQPTVIRREEWGYASIDPKVPS